MCQSQTARSPTVPSWTKASSASASSLCGLFWFLLNNRVVSWLLGSIDYGIYLSRLLGSSRPTFFSKGYGDVAVYHRRFHSVMEKLPAEEKHEMKMGDATTTATFGLSDKDIEWGETKYDSEKTISIQEGRFLSPVSKDLPQESEYCRFHLVEPVNSNKYSKEEHNDQGSSGMYYIIMLPATGEMGIRDRLKTAKRLAQEYGNVCSVIVTAPYYSIRKPNDQTAFFLNSVTDILLQSEAIIEEAASLCHYFLHSSSSSKVCFTGFSWGGAMSGCAAALALRAGMDGRRIACAPYVGNASPCALADGVLESSIQWEALRQSKDEPYETTRLNLFQEFYKTQLETIYPAEARKTRSTKEKESSRKQLAVVKGYAMAHDQFLKAKYVKEFEKQIQGSLYSDFQMEWYPGGHAFAAIVRPVLHKQLIAKTIQEF